MTCPEVVAYMEVLMAVDKLQPSSISQGDIEAVEDAVGSGSGAWDMVDPAALLAACAKQVLKSMEVPFATPETRRLIAAAVEAAVPREGGGK